MVGMGRRQQQGASLVEVLVVMGILAIAILAFIRLYPSGFPRAQAVGSERLGDTLRAA
jgi:prepilin-type N-terminal cleavage/methylation domain-containing protein